MSVIWHYPIWTANAEWGKEKNLDLVEALLESGYSEAKFENSYI